MLMKHYSGCHSGAVNCYSFLSHLLKVTVDLFELTVLYSPESSFKLSVACYGVDQVYFLVFLVVFIVRLSMHQPIKILCNVKNALLSRAWIKAC